MICSGCWSLAQKEQEITQQEIILDKKAEIKSAKNRILLSWFFAGIGFVVGIVAGLLFASDKKNDVNPILIFLIATIGYTYVFWSMFWSLPVVWGWTKSIGGKIGFTFVGGNMLIWVIILSFCCSVPLTISIYYGVFGGAIYQFLKYRKIASQSI